MTFPDAAVEWRGTPGGAAPLVVLLHGRGSSERDFVGLADHLPQGLEYAAVRAPIAEGGGYAWFANRGIGRPVAESLAETMSWFRDWLDTTADGRPVVLVGFSGGAAFAGGLLLGTLPFDAGVPAEADRLAGVPVLVAQGDTDVVIPRELLDRTWAYLHTESGADLTAHRDAGGHGLSVGTVTALAAWLTRVASPPRS